MVKSILYAAGEAQPFASTGGLGDVMGALPATIKKNYPNCDVRAVMPLYSKIGDNYKSRMVFLRWITVRLGWRTVYCGIFTLELNGIKWYFIDNEHYFKRRGLYGDFDDGERFSYFSVCVLEMMRALDFYPDILHCNDWQTALAVILLKQKYYEYTNYKKIRAIFTIHNIQYQGVFDMGLLSDIFNLPYKDKGIVEYDGLITDLSCGLYHITQMYSYKLTGIVNGIDYDAWNPETDRALPANYSADSLDNKSICKRELQRYFRLPEKSDAPIISMITRLVEPKGVDLVKRVIDEIMGEDVQFILLGTGDYDYERYFDYLNGSYTNKYRAIIDFDRDLSRLIYAGSDIFLMPSRSEACGLSQMISSRYGTLPLVHETGGLYDTIKSFKDGGNGFTFKEYNAHEMLFMLKDAIAMYKKQPDEWKKLQKTAMKTDFSWDKSAESYYVLYNSIGY